MFRTHILSIVTFWPLVGMFVLFFMNKENKTPAPAVGEHRRGGWVLDFSAAVVLV